jgi:hypothetical protein
MATLLEHTGLEHTGKVRPTPLRVIHATIRMAFSGMCLMALQCVAYGQWQQGIGIGNSNVGVVAASSGVMVAAIGAEKPDTLYASTDNGNNWTEACANVPTVVNSMVASGATFIVGSDNPGGSYYSTNFGGTWTSNDLDLPNSPHSGDGIFALDVIDNNIFAATVAGVCQQGSAGAAWSLDTVGTTFGDGEVPTIVSLFASGSNIFVATQGAGVYLSTNSGASWEQINSGLPSGYYYGIVADYFSAIGSALFIAVADTDQIHTDIYFTINNGKSWSKATLQPQNWGDVFGFVSSGQDLFIAADSSVYVSSDNGVDWVPSNLGLPVSAGEVTSIDTSGPNLVIGTASGGVWTRKLSDFGGASVAASTDRTSDFNLSVAGNPAYGSGATVTFTLPNAGVVQISLIDEIGRTIRILQKGFAPAGSNEVAIDTHSFEPGTYLVRLEADGTSVMQKLVIAP